MKSKWIFILHEHSKQLWFRASLYCLLGVVTALLGIAFQHQVPEQLQTYIQPDAVRQILEILASSMLIVATFALSVMVQAISAASTTATPRATQLLTENTPAQNALAAFIGAFLFSIVGLIALSAGIYGGGGAVLLFAATIFVVLLVVIMLLRWVRQLSRLGRVEDSIDLVEHATGAALKKRAHHPFLGGRPLKSVPDTSYPVNCRTIGYVQYIDMEKLQKIAEHQQIEIYIDVLPGSFCDLVRNIAYTSREVTEPVKTEICQALVIGGSRTFPQDPRFGLIALAEIAVRALSPGVNDPGTAIDVVGTSVRLLHHWAEERSQLDGLQVQYDRVWALGLDEADFFDDIYSPLIRDGASFLEVSIRLQKALHALSKFGFPPFIDPAREFSEALVQRCARHLTEAELERVKQASRGEG